MRKLKSDGSCKGHGDVGYTRAENQSHTPRINQSQASELLIRIATGLLTDSYVKGAIVPMPRRDANAFIFPMDIFATIANLLRFPISDAVSL